MYINFYLKKLNKVFPVKVQIEDYTKNTNTNEI